MIDFRYNYQSIITRFLKKIADNDIEKNFLLTHKEVRFLAYQIRTDWHSKKLDYGQHETNQEVSFWLDRLCEYGICHKQRSRIAKHLIELLEKTQLEEPDNVDIDDVFGSSNPEF